MNARLGSDDELAASIATAHGLDLVGLRAEAAAAEALQQAEHDAGPFGSGEPPQEEAEVFGQLRTALDDPNRHDAVLRLFRNPAWRGTARKLSPAARDALAQLAKKGGITRKTLQKVLDLPKAGPSTDAADQSDPKSYFRTDAGNAKRFADQQRATLAWVPGVGWHGWTGARWERTDESSVVALSTECALTLYNEARDASAETQHLVTRHALASQGRARIEAAAALAKGYLLVKADKLDCDPMLFNCRNGTVDLRTGTLRPHRREDFITRLAPVDYDPAACSPLWDAFLERVVPSRDVRDFLQRAVGYTLSGDVSAQVLLFLYGKGANGKSVFANVVQAMLGDYASTGAPDLLVERKNEAHPTDQAALWGRRAVICSETEQGRWLAESRVKSLTGGDAISARFMRQDFFTFTPTHKFWLLGNHQPRVRGTDLAIWRRILQVPFEQTIPEAERDPKLAAKLRAEAPGITAWAVRGGLAWQKDGLKAPREVSEATAAYKDSQDHVGTFLTEACRVADNERCTSAELYGAYSAWCEKGGERAWTSTALGTALRDRGFASGRTNRGKGWKGVSPLKVPGSAGFSGSPHEEEDYRTNQTTRHYPALEAGKDLVSGHGPACRCAGDSCGAS